MPAEAGHAAVVSAAVQLIPYALVAVLSPLGFAATITVLRTGRLKALGFGIGVVAGQLVACAALIALGAAITPSRTRAHPTFGALLELGLGIALVCAAFVAHRRPETASRPPSTRAQAALARLQRVHVLTATAVGLLLGIGGPKRLVLTGFAAASITATGITGTDRAFLVCWYVLLATALVWLPVIAYLLLGRRALSRLDAAFEWLKRYRRPATVYALAVIGAVLLIDGALLL
jgi:hypothetical protein